MSEKKVTVNSGLAMIFNENLGELAAFNGGMINSGELVASSKSYQKLMENGFNINAGSTNVLEITGEVLLFENEQSFLLADKEKLEGKYIVIKGSVVLPTTYPIENLSKVEGFYVVETLYYPSNITLENISGMKSAKVRKYPEESRFIKSKVFSVDEQKVKELPPESTCYITGVLEIMDDSLKNIAHGKNIKWIAEKVIMKEEYEELFEEVKADKVIIVPKDHAYIKELTLSQTTYLLFGGKIFVEKDFLLQPKAIKELEKFESIIVEGMASLTLEGIEPFKKIGKARKIEGFQGTLEKVNGTFLYTSEMLKGAIAMGKEVTLKINGLLTFSEDVQVEELESIAAIHCNGLIKGPEQIISVLQEKAETLNGTIIPLNYNDNDLLKNMVGDDDDEKHITINTGELIII